MTPASIFDAFEAQHAIAQRFINDAAEPVVQFHRQPQRDHAGLDVAVRSDFDADQAVVQLAFDEARIKNVRLRWRLKLLAHSSPQRGLHLAHPITHVTARSRNDNFAARKLFRRMPFSDTG